MSAGEAAAKAVDLSGRAAEAGTFGVGGFLMDRSGRILAEATNAVVRAGEVQDPTAHVERQLIDWYFENRRLLRNAEPGDLTIVSSLDPCAMCAGAILLTGMNVVALAEDPLSGVHADGCPHRMPAELWPQAERTMGLFEVPGRAGQAGHISSTFRERISPDLARLSERHFQESLDVVKDMIGGAEEPMDGIDPAVLGALESVSNELPEPVLIPLQPLRLAAATSIGRISALLADDTCALVDGEGLLMLVARARTDLAPSRSSVLELVRAYVELRKTAMRRLGTALPHQRFCSLIKLRAPADPAVALMEFGALGSFFERPALGRRLPAFGYIEPENGRNAERFLASLPPLYNSVIGLNIGPVTGQITQSAVS